MAVVNTKATAITNRDSKPVVISPAHLTRGPVYEAVGTVETAAADDDGSIYRMARLRSSDRISQILLANDAITSGTDYDVGVYRTAADGGAVVTKDVFADGLDLSSAVAMRDVAYNDQAADISEVGMRIWERLGLTVDPMVEYDICITANTVGSAAGTLAMVVRYCQGN